METKTEFPAKSFPLVRIIGGALGLLLLAATPTVRANVYAADIQINGSLFGITNTPAPGSPATITYRLNQSADLGCTVNILNGGTVVATIAGGTAMGLNTVQWGGTNNAGSVVGGGSYSVSITATATGFTNWTQISVDTNAGMPAFYPWGIDVDKNTNSPYYGRVIMSCAGTGSGSGAERDGLFKMNADGSQADEGWYGNAGYTSDDAGNSPIAGQMPDSGGYNPGIIRIGEDDRIYWCDNSAVGSIVACDMLATTNQIVITSGTYQDSNFDVSHYGGIHNYQNNPDISDLGNNSGNGIRQFDVAGTTGPNAAVYICDTGDYPSAGIWMYHLTNGASDPADTVGTGCVIPDGSTFLVTGAGLSVDDSLDVFVGQNRSGSGDTHYRAFCFSNWNNGTLPPEGNGSSNSYALPLVKAPAWKQGAANDGLSAIWDTVIDSRTHPTMVAVGMAAGASEAGGYLGQNGGIAVLSATTGTILATNLDITNWYNGVAFDNVGNVYGASRSLNLWRVWSPPGRSTNTTVAVAKVIVPVPTPFTITSITATSAGGGCYNVTINFTADSSLSASAFTLLSSSTANGPYTPAAGASVTGSAGTYQATGTICSAVQFFELEHN